MGVWLKKIGPRMGICDRPGMAIFWNTPPEFSVRIGLQKTLADKARDAEGKDVDGRAGDDLVDTETDGQDGEEHAEDTACDDGSPQAKPKTAGDAREDDRNHRPGQHHALDGDVDHPRSFAHDAAHSAKRDGRRGGDGKREDAQQVDRLIAHGPDQESRNEDQRHNAQHQDNAFEAPRDLVEPQETGDHCQHDQCGACRYHQVRHLDDLFLGRWVELKRALHARRAVHHEENKDGYSHDQEKHAVGNRLASLSASSIGANGNGGGGCCGHIELPRQLVQMGSPNYVPSTWKSRSAIDN